MKGYEEMTDIFTPEGIKQLKEDVKLAKPYGLVLNFVSEGEAADYSIKMKGNKVYGKRVALALPNEVGVKKV